MNKASNLFEKVHQLMEQLVFDEELFTIGDYHVKIIEEYLEFFSYGLSILLRDDSGIYWLEENESDSTLVIMPRLVEDVLKKEVFSSKIPFVFSSATLSQAGDYSHLAGSLGIEAYDSFSVASPFDYENQMKVKSHPEAELPTKWEEIGELLQKNEGESLR